MNRLSGSTPYFSLIIPAYNEEAYLPVLLDSVAAARARYEGGPDDIEIVVVDDASKVKKRSSKKTFKNGK